MSKFTEHAAAVLARLQKRYDTGDKDALLEALKWCLSFNILAPDWVRAHFNGAVMRYWLYEVETLDEAFGVERSKDPRSVAAGRRASRLISEIWQHIWTQIDSGKSRDDEFFAAVGRKFGISKTKVKEYWRLGNAAFGLHPPKKAKRPPR